MNLYRIYGDRTKRPIRGLFGFASLAVAISFFRGSVLDGNELIQEEEKFIMAMDDARNKHLIGSTKIAADLRQVAVKQIEKISQRLDSVSVWDFPRYFGIWLALKLNNSELVQSVEKMSASANYHLACSLMRQGEYEAAQTLLQSSCQKFQESGSDYQEVARNYIRRGDLHHFQRFEQASRSAYSTDIPEMHRFMNLRANNNRGVANYSHGKFQDAITHFHSCKKYLDLIFADLEESRNGNWTQEDVFALRQLLGSDWKSTRGSRIRHVLEPVFQNDLVDISYNMSEERITRELAERYRLALRKRLTVMFNILESSAMAILVGETKHGDVDLEEKKKITMQLLKKYEPEIISVDQQWWRDIGQFRRDISLTYTAAALGYDYSNLQESMSEMKPELMSLQGAASTALALYYYKKDQHKKEAHQFAKTAVNVFALMKVLATPRDHMREAEAWWVLNRLRPNQYKEHVNASVRAIFGHQPDMILIDHPLFIEDP